MKKYLGLLGIIILLSGCVSHMSEQECLSTNWQQVGFNDGQAGQAPRDLSKPIQDCQKFQVAVDTQAYQRGWLTGMKKYCVPSYDLGLADGRTGNPYENVLQRSDRCQQANLRLDTREYKRGHLTGLQSFCTHENGMNIGLQGKQPPGVCPAGLKARFISGWNAGAKQFCANSANAFALGKQGQPYPQACTPAFYVAFKSEYDRGAMIRNRSGELQQQINYLNDGIKDRVSRYGLRETYDYRGYELGDDQSEEARRALHEIRGILQQQQNLQAQQAQLQVTG
ncbi:MAG: hypothetical protein K0S11_734 [Gammaproteobacteria bacterium]|jgi:hypothetical protein|nr:hypothetical protein [Gammaproteobacteria bacterium]